MNLSAQQQLNELYAPTELTIADFDSDSKTKVIEFPPCAEDQTDTDNGFEFVGIAG